MRAGVVERERESTGHMPPVVAVTSVFWSPRKVAAVGVTRKVKSGY
jgi:hypothetical protein